MLNIEHLLMKQRYFALEEISTVFFSYRVRAIHYISF